MSKTKFVAIRNQADTSVLELYFLDVIQDSYEWWTGLVLSKVQEIIDKVNFYNPKTIKCIIDSVGGDAKIGLTIYNFLKRCDCKIQVEIIGLAGSIASVIAMAASNGKLLIAKNGFMMIHKAEGMVGGTSEEIRQAADLVDKYTAQIVDVYSQRTGKTVDEIQKLIENGDYWMTGEEAVAQGFADATFNNEANLNLQIAARLDKDIYKNIPAQIRAQVIPEDTQQSDSTFINNSIIEMKKFFTDIVNAIRGVQPAADNKTPITNQIADAVAAPFEKLGDEIEKTIDEKVKNATGEEHIKTITAKAKDEVLNSIDFTGEKAKAAIDSAVSAAVTNATKEYSDKIKTLEDKNVELVNKNKELEADVTELKGKSSVHNQNDPKQSVPIGTFK
jgi:ATP-dependent protease ClpP protease subunit